MFKKISSLGLIMVILFFISSWALNSSQEVKEVKVSTQTKGYPKDKSALQKPSPKVHCH